MEVPVDVHHLDAVLGLHGDLCGDRQPVLEILILLIYGLTVQKPQVQHGEQDEVDHLLCEAGLVLLPPLFDLGLVPMFEERSKVKLVVAQH